MTSDQDPAQVEPGDLDRVEELIRYLAAHDGRLPPDDVPLAWWLVDALEQPVDHPVRRLLAGIPVKSIGVDVFPKKAHAWSIWLARRDQLVWADQRGRSLDDILPKDSTLRAWVNGMLSRHHLGTLGPVETMLLERTPLWDFERELNTKNSQQQLLFKTGITAVREYYTKHKHADIPEGYTVGGLDIQKWWHDQRWLYARPGSGMKEHLRQQFARLGNLGVDLRTDKERAAADPVFRYKDRLGELADFVAKHGVAALPRRGEKFATNAWEWIARYQAGTLDPELVTALEAIDGWDWDGEGDLAPLRAYALSFGHLNPERGYTDEEGQPIERRVYRIRQEGWNNLHRSGAARRNGKHLDELSRQGWNAAMQALRQWHQRYDSPPSPDQVTEDGFHLGEFVQYATRAAAQAHLSWAQLKDLSLATGNAEWLETDPGAYAGAMQALTQFAQVNRHCHPSWNWSWERAGEDYELPRFLLRIAADREADDLTPVEALRLEALPGWAWSRTERAQARAKVASEEKGAAVRSKRVREPIRSVRTDLADPDTSLNQVGQRQFLPGD